MTDRTASGVSRRLVLGAGVSVLPGLALAQAVRPRLYDTHAHLISTDRVKYPPKPLGGAALRDQDFNDPIALDRLISDMKANNVERALAVQRAHIYGYDNSLILDSAAAKPDLMRPVVVLDGMAADTPDTLRDWVKNRDVAGLRITSPGKAAGLTWINSPAALRTWKAADDLRMPMIVMLLPGAEPGLAAIKDIAAAYPNTPIVLDHCGWPPAKGGPDHGFGPAWTDLKRCRNVYFKFTSINFETLQKAGLPAPPFIEHLVKTFGADRVMWGSDIGQTQGTYTQFVTSALDGTAGLSRADRRAALYDTAAAVFRRRG